MHRYLVKLMWVGVVLYTAIMLVNIAIHPEMCFHSEDNFSAEIRVLFQTLQSPLGKQKAVSMVINFELLGGCRSISRRKILQVEVCERPSSCARRGIDCLGFTDSVEVLDRSALPLTSGCRLVVYRTGLLEFSY
ncbi:hypothetical protein J6590_096506 [Homalodisca vitripennis]|nr:hypothetical protein J6590_096506 [Homalodisca vitripennis]